jgi:alkanesulfonate monooxygenase SsuD/methylene tetrahydromethanopterin reductase-like flavin-dependent oxidoreductase (luciferase family)
MRENPGARFPPHRHPNEEDEDLMKLGIGLPQMMPWGLDRGMVLEWARRADEAGFHSLGTLDRPNYDSWEPLVTLAAAAAATKRIRLATAILQLSNRNETLVAKQAAVVDRLSEGRLDLGVAPGMREDDFDVYGAELSDRRRFRAQVARIREVWRLARESTEGHGNVGPAPVQDPGPPIWIGAATPGGIRRATEIADAFVFTAALPPETIGEMIPDLRARAEANGKTTFGFHSIAYCGVGDPDDVLEIARAQLLRYYRNPDLPVDAIVHRGSTDDLAAVARRYADTGVDSLILMPQVPSLEQVDALARDVLPDYATP